MTSKVEQGKMRLFLEIFPKSMDVKKVPMAIKVEEQPKECFEFRCIIWTCEDIPIMDVEGTTDI